MIAALAQASGQLGRPDWLRLAEDAFAAVLRHMGDGDRLFHSWRAGRRLPMAFLDDYAQMSRAALALFQQTGTSGLPRAGAAPGSRAAGRTSTTAGDGGYLPQRRRGRRADRAPEERP